MQKQDANDILNRYLADTATEPEKAWVETWYLKDKEYDHSFDPEHLAEDKKADLENLLSVAARGKTKVIWPKIAVAAAIATTILGASLFYFNKPTNTDQQNTMSKVQDVLPGKIGATLTLASGKTIKLSNAANGELANEAGVKISKSKDGKLIYEITGTDTDPNKINILSTANGETYEVRLPDGSSVWLNAASTLKYPASFAKLKDRRVELTGEGYFEVAKDKAHPFIVTSKGQEVEVLGTHFNVNTYKDEALTKTTLLEGSVRISTDGVSKILKPGQQAVKNDTGIQISTADTEIAVAWKNNEFMFEDESIESIMKMVERWYNVDVVYQGEKTKEKFVGAVSRFDKVSNVLRILESTGSVHFKIEGRTIYVYP